MEEKKVPRGPIFILGCSKSGTSLMRNLFDGHSTIFAVPAESHFFEYTGSWVNYYFRRSQPKNYTFAEMKEQLTGWIDFSNKRVNNVADGFTAGKWNVEKFKEVMYSKEVSNLRELSDLYVESMYVSLFDKPYQNLSFAEKSVENAEFVLEWSQLYPEARFVHILRNPYSNLVAIRKFMDSLRMPFLNRALLGMHDSYYSLYKNLKLADQSRYKVIIYEHLIANPEKVMRELADFIDIDYEEILTQPTLMGKPWGGNSTSGKKFSSVSNQNIEKWKQDITKYEVSIVNELFPHVLRDFNFEVIDEKDLKNRIYPKEGIRHFIMNKISSYYLPNKPRTRRVLKEDESKQQ